MAQKMITGYTPSTDSPHIYAEDDAQIYRSIFGQSGITESDNKLACTLIDNNTVQLASGAFVNQGYFVVVPGGSTEQLSVQSGSQNMYRKDLLVAHFVRGGGSVADKHYFEVVTGTPAASLASAADPQLTQNDLASGGSERQEALYRITISGLNISAIDRVAPYVGSYYQ
jgi:hypothetical protein